MSPSSDAGRRLESSGLSLPRPRVVPASAVMTCIVLMGVAGMRFAGALPIVPPLPVPVPALLPPGAEPAPDSPAPPPPAPDRCRAARVGPIGSPGRGVSTHALGRAPAAYEVGSPAGRFRGRRPRGVMLLIHGGGWYIVGPGPLATERAEAGRWRRRGWLTVNLDYPACGRSLGGVLWFHDRVRRRYGRRLPLCASGASAGAQLALVLAARRRDVACAIAEGPPTDLRTIAHHPAASGSRAGSRAVASLALHAFGRHRLASMSAVAQARRIRARLLLATARRDIVIPLAQARELRRAVRRHHARAYVDLLTLAPGSMPWVHAPVSAAALRRLYAAERRLVRPL